MDQIAIRLLNQLIQIYFYDTTRTKKRVAGSEDDQESEPTQHGSLLLSDIRRGCKESFRTY